MSSLDRNDPCSCGSGEKFNNCCIGNISTTPASQVKPANQILQATLQQQQIQQKFEKAIAHHQVGKLAEAEALYRQILSEDVRHAGSLHMLGVVAYQMGHCEFSVDLISKAIKLNSRVAEFHSNLGIVFKKQGKLDEAIASYGQALAIKSDYAEALFNLGNALQVQGKLDEAIASYEQALAIKSDYAETLSNLGNALQVQGKLDEAVVSYEQALAIKPDDAEVLSNLGNVLREQGLLDQAIACHEQALAVKPDYAQALSNLGVVLREQGKLNQAIASYEQALAFEPGYAEALSNLGVVLKEQGKLDEAIACHKQALAVKPEFAIAHSNLIFTLDLSPKVQMAELFQERQQWDKIHAATLWQEPHHSNAPIPLRRLRVGYVSADFNNHSAPRVFGGMLTRYDRLQFDIFAYSNSMKKADRFTDLFKQNVTVWRNIAGLPDEAVAAMIREDRIDILVDLSGHSAGNRLLVFARKPAPIQISAWGYAMGAGIRAMDVLFSDPVMVPPQEKQYVNEEVRYLPSVVGSFFDETVPEVNELPALSIGAITFGSFNRLAKVSEETYRAWAEILLRVPRSRLILKTGELNDEATRERVAGQFTQAGVAADRIIMLGKTSWHEHTKTYHQVDFALDPFPHGGGVTALEGLMMGVPVVTLRWPTVVGRLSASIMTTLGLTDWIAETREEYVELAIKKAVNLLSLVSLRQRLRNIFTSSVIGDQAAYVRAVEEEYRKLWQEWCERRGSPI